MALSKKQVLIKRLFDFFVSLLLLIVFFLPILILVLISTLATGQFGVFSQKRVGYNGRLFTIYKIRSLSQKNKVPVNWFERALRESKLDELPQLFNVVIGEMSLVGPRPDLPGYADQLQGEDRLILTVRPGITGPATIKYKNEDRILALQSNPETYNDEVIWPDKVRINKDYVERWSFKNDLKYMIRTFFD